MHVPHLNPQLVLALALFAHAWVMRVDDHPRTAASLVGWTVIVITLVVLLSQVFLAG